MVETSSGRVRASRFPTHLGAAVDGSLPGPRSRCRCMPPRGRSVVEAGRHRAGSPRDLCPERRTRPSPEVIIRRTRSLPRSDTTKLGRFPLTTAVRTLLDLGSVVDEDRLEAALESAYRRGLTDPERAQRRLRTYATRGSRGAAALKRILAARGNAEPAGSVLEVKFIRLARGGHLPPFERQWRVLDGDGLVGCIDFAYPDLRLGVEVGGKGSHTGPAAEERDSRRHNRLTAQGWRMLYFGWSDVVNRPEHVLHVVRSEHARLRHAGGLHESQARDARA
jgi:very-short-patch-repair endonuclease